MNENNLKNQKIFGFSKTLFIISICYSVLALTPNNFGDPNDYLNLAKTNILSSTVLRAPGYPLFIKITSLNLNYLYLTTIFQIIIFYLAALKLEKSLSKYSKYSYFIILILSIPKFSYSQTLLFPDGLILSLFILLVSMIIEKNYKYAVFVGFLITFIKVFFIFIFLIMILIFFLKNKKSYYKFYTYLIIFPFLILFYFLQPEYLVQFMYGKNKNFIYKINEINLCGFTFKDQDLTINVQHGYYFPIYKKENINNINIKNCDESELSKSLSRKIINKMLNEKPLELSFAYSVAFVRSVIGMSTRDFNHLTSMIINHNKNYEIFLKNLSSLDLKDFKQSSKNTLNDKLNKLQINYEDRFTETILIIIFILNLYFFVRNKKKFLLNPLAIILINSSIFLTFFSSLIADRYIMYHIVFNFSILLLMTSKFEK